MKTTGIILLSIGLFSLIGAFIAASKGENIFSGPIVAMVIGAFLISTANKKKRRLEEKKRWEN